MLAVVQFTAETGGSTSFGVIKRVSSSKRLWNSRDDTRFYASQICDSGCSIDSLNLWLSSNTKTFMHGRWHRRDEGKFMVWTCFSFFWSSWMRLRWWLNVLRMFVTLVDRSTCLAGWQSGWMHEFEMSGIPARHLHPTESSRPGAHLCEYFTLWKHRRFLQIGTTGCFSDSR